MEARKMLSISNLFKYLLGSGLGYRKEGDL